MDIQKRFERVLAIYFQLQAKPLVRAQELAERFEVSLRTIYRDIHALTDAGIPIYGEAGKGYALVEGYKIAPTLFSKEEALSFAAAEKLMQNFVDKNLSRHFSDALIKMKGILRYTDKEEVAELEKLVLMDGQNQLFNQDLPEALSHLMAAIAQKKQLLIAYLKPQSQHTEQRSIEPVGLFHEHGFWYVMAFCLLRQDYRQFRLDRFQKIDRLSSDFCKQHETLSFYLQKRISPKGIKVVILVDKERAHYLSWERKYYGFESEKEMEGKVEMTFSIPEKSEAFARWYLMFADSAVIVEPLTLRTTVQRLMQDSIAKQASTA